jgi:hypothetical protein
MTRKLTNLQVLLLIGCLAADHRDGRHPVGCQVWTSTVTDLLPNPKSAGGVFSAAQKAGLVDCQPDGGDGDSSLALTQAGWEAICDKYAVYPATEDQDYNAVVDYILAMYEGKQADKPLSPAEEVVDDDPALDLQNEAIREHNASLAAAEEGGEAPAGEAPAEGGEAPETTPEIPGGEIPAPAGEEAEEAPAAPVVSKEDLRKARKETEGAILAALKAATDALTVPQLLDAAAEHFPALGQAKRRDAHYETWAAVVRLERAKKLSIAHLKGGAEMTAV